MSFVYPITTAWFYGKGWLYDLDTPLIDGPGAISVYTLAGSLATVGLLLVGKRPGIDLETS